MSSSSRSCCSKRARTRTTGRPCTTTSGGAPTSISSCCSPTGSGAATAGRGAAASARGRRRLPRLLEDQLLFAADGDDPDRVELLIRHGVDVNGMGTRHPSLRGRNAYELALTNGAMRVAELLSAAGATAAPQ